MKKLIPKFCVLVMLASANAHGMEPKWDFEVHATTIGNVTTLVGKNGGLAPISVARPLVSKQSRAIEYVPL